MKASDICVGDWLNIYTFPNDNPKQDDLFPAKVNAVSIFDPFKEPDDVLVELVIERTKGIASRPLDTCLPIPLTEEILVKNGWRKESITIDGYYANWCGEIPICQEEDEFNYERIELTYVHTLQHLLRLVGVQKEIEL